MESPPLKPYLSKEDQDIATLVEAVPECVSNESSVEESGGQQENSVHSLENAREDDQSETFRQMDIDTPKSQARPAPKQEKGLLRHRIIVSSCLGLSATLFALSTLNLANAFQQPATINSKFEIHPIKPRAELRSDLTYKNSSADKDAFLPVVETGWTSKTEGFVDRNGKVVIEPKFAELFEFTGNRARAKLPGKDSKWGFINRAGKYVIKPQFESAGDFSYGLASVWDGASGIGGFIDTDGKYLFQTKMRSAPVQVGENIYYYQDPWGRWIYLNSKFKSLFDNDSSIQTLDDLRGHSTPSEVFKLSHNGKCGLIDSTGKVILEPKFQNISGFNQGVATIYDGSKYGFFDIKGKMLVSPQYDETTGYNAIIGVRKSGKPWQFLDKDGKLINMPTVDALLKTREGMWFSDGRGAVYNKGKFYWINERGESVVDVKAKNISAFQNGVATFWNGECWQYIDTKGQTAFKGKFPTAEPFAGGEAEVTVAGPLHFLIKQKTIDEENRRLKSWKEDIDRELGRTIPRE